MLDAACRAAYNDNHDVGTTALVGVLWFIVLASRFPLQPSKTLTSDRVGAVDHGPNGSSSDSCCGALSASVNCCTIELLNHTYITAAVEVGRYRMIPLTSLDPQTSNQQCTQRRVALRSSDMPNRLR